MGFMVITTETWHLTNYVLFDDKSCLHIQQSVYLYSQDILSISQGLQDPGKTAWFSMKTRFWCATSYGLAPKEPNDNEIKLYLL